MPIGFAFNVDLRIKKRSGEEISLTREHNLSPIDKAFLYAILDFELEKFLKFLEIEYNIALADFYFLKNKFKRDDYIKNRNRESANRIL